MKQQRRGQGRAGEGGGQGRAGHGRVGEQAPDPSQASAHAGPGLLLLLAQTHGHCAPLGLSNAARTLHTRERTTALVSSKSHWLSRRGQRTDAESV